jgi:hypothetical protein
MWLSRKQYKRRLRRAYTMGFTRGYELVNGSGADTRQGDSVEQGLSEDARWSVAEFKRHVREIVESKGAEFD